MPVSVTLWTPILTVQGLGTVLCMSRPEYEHGDEGDECEDAKATSSSLSPSAMLEAGSRPGLAASSRHLDGVSCTNA